MSDTLILTLKNDYLFKLLLGSEENKDCLQDFLECVLDMPADTIADLELLDKELTKGAMTDKTGIHGGIDTPIYHKTTRDEVSTRSLTKAKQRRTCCTLSIRFCVTTQ